MLAELWSLQGDTNLQFTWFAFFLTFVVWFNLAPLGHTSRRTWVAAVQIRLRAILHVALTVPARILIGMVLDKYGTRSPYSTLLDYFSMPSLLVFASAQDFNQLCELPGCCSSSCMVQGFVIGIAMVH